MFSYKVVTDCGFSYDTKTIDSILKIISKTVEKTQNGTLNFVFLDPDSIKNLNKKYRNIDSPTDVLSFHYFDDFSQLTQEDIAGEIVFCEEKIFSQAQEENKSPEEEFYVLVIHSILHILGYDHETDSDYAKMQPLETHIHKEVFGK